MSPPGTSILVRRGLWFALVGGVVTVGIALATVQLDVPAALAVLHRARPAWIVAAMALMTTGLVFLTARWRSLMPTDRPVPLLRLTGILTAGTLMHYAVPGPVGELVAAGMAADRFDVGVEQAFAAGIHARFVGLALAGTIAALLFFVLDLHVPDGYRTALGASAVAIGVGAVVLFVLSARPDLLRRTGALVFTQRVWPARWSELGQSRVVQLADALAAVGHLGPRRYAEAAFWALAGHAAVIGGIEMTALGLGAAPDPAGLVFTYAMTTAGAVVLFGVPGAQLGWDAMFTTLLVATAGLPLQIALGVVVVVRSQQLVVAVLGAIALIAARPVRVQ